MTCLFSVRLRSNRLILAFFFLLTSAFAQVVPGGGSSSGPTSIVTGQIQTATGGSINNGTLTFTLSQPAVVSGTATLATQTSSCYTTTQGLIVGLPDPTALPIVSANTISGTLAAGTYYVEVFYTNAAGSVSAVSPEMVLVLTAQGSLIINPPAFQPSAANGYGVAIGTASGAETIQGTVTSFVQFTQSTALIAGATPAAVNNSTCNVYFSDQLIPTGTYYTVNLLNRNGSQISGYPQTWCTYGGAGGVINVSQGAPTGNCNVNGVFYPAPIFANPTGIAIQSVSTPISFPNGIVGPTTISGTTTFTGPEINTNSLTVQNAGLFTNTQMNEYLSSIVNGCNPLTEFQATQGSQTVTAGLTGCVSMPSTSTVHQVNGVEGYVTSNANSSSGTTNNAVGLYGQCRNLVSNGACWGQNTLVQDLVGDSGHVMIGNEIDLNLKGAPARFHGIGIYGAAPSGTMPAAPPVGNTNGSLSRAAVIEAFFPSGLQWPAGLVFSRGSVNGPGLQLDGTCYTGAQPCSSQTITQTGYDGSNVAHTSSLFTDSNGNYNIVPASGGGVKLAAAPIGSGTVAGLTGTGACASIAFQVGGSWAGKAQCTGSTGASTLTITFAVTAPNGYVCDVQDETTRANLFQQTSHTNTTCVLTVTSVTNNDVFVFTATAF